MFRVIKDPHMNIWYVHKKFLWWWIKWGSPKSNMVSDIAHVPLIMNKGSYNFSSGEYGTFYYIMGRQKPKMEYFKNSQEFKEQYAEFLI